MLRAKTKSGFQVRLCIKPKVHAIAQEGSVRHDNLKQTLHATSSGASGMDSSSTQSKPTTYTTGACNLYSASHFVNYIRKQR